MRTFIVAMVGLPLAGCLGVSMPPKELPDWAMNQQAEAGAPARIKVARMRPARSIAAERAPDRTVAVSYVPASSTSISPATAAQTDVKPFSPEWQAREDAFDNKLRRTMSICRGC
jgi:hypothetical protein